MAARIQCPGCRDTLGTVPGDDPDRDAGLKGRQAECDRCGSRVDVYFY